MNTYKSWFQTKTHESDEINISNQSAEDFYSFQSMLGDSDTDLGKVIIPTTSPMDLCYHA